MWEEAAQMEADGPNHSDPARAAMERATTAREAVEITGGLIDEYGYSTYGGNWLLIAKQTEARTSGDVT